MNFNDIDAALATLDPNAVFRIGNEARSPQSYLFNQFLPDFYSYDYVAEAGNMTITATMAQMVGVDSPYPQGGAMQSSDFSEKIAKLAQKVVLPEAEMRKMQAAIRHYRSDQKPTTQLILDQYFNFINKLLVQPHLDTAEWMRARAMITGQLQWICNGIELNVDYKFKAGSIMTPLAGANGFGGTTSKFWVTILAMQTFLKNNVRAFVAHPDTINLILSNSVNQLELIGIQKINRHTQVYSFVKQVGSLEKPATDPRYRVEIISYGLENSILDPDPANRGQTISVPVINPGELLAVGNALGDDFVVGEGSTPAVSLATNNNVGHFHWGPTTEQNGVPGLYVNAFRPEQRPWSFEGDSVSNVLPVITVDDKLISIVSTMTPA